MSTLSDPHIDAPIVGTVGLSRAQFAALAVIAAILGLSTISYSVVALWSMWTTDALKSIGVVIPVVSLLLILRAWRSLGWRAEGTWWGVPLLIAAIGAAWIQQHTVLFLVVSPQWATPLLPPSAVLLAYGSAVVLLVGGTRLYRAALFPILLLWFANPVPHVFSLLVDLPLQRVSAEIARAFAMDLGQQLTPDRLRLMFTPEFGMFIAPGCNGIRGAITMGFIALIAGYIYRFRWYAHTLVVIGAVLLGYVFNLLRLCCLVLYYLLALHFTSLQNKAENADYLIGAALFLFATIVLFTAVRRLGDGAGLKKPQTAIQDNQGSAELSIRYARLAVMLAVGVFGCATLARAHAQTHPSNAGTVNQADRFPKHLGKYTLVRSWNETLVTGSVVYVWAEYSTPGMIAPVSIGVSPILGLHDPLICHFIRGDHPLWQGPLTMTTADTPVSFSSAFYSDGVTRSLEASTQCSGFRCGESATERAHFGFVYAAPGITPLISASGQQTIPVLVRAETLDMAEPVDAARQQLTRSLQGFLASVRLNEVAQPFNR